jgi:hypothetical protein
MGDELQLILSSTSLRPQADLATMIFFLFIFPGIFQYTESSLLAYGGFY